MEENEIKFRKLNFRKKVKLVRLAKKLKLCNNCKLQARNPTFNNYCKYCLKDNKEIFDKMNKITGET